jgi:hypothetical protein
MIPSLTQKNYKMKNKYVLRAVILRIAALFAACQKIKRKQSRDHLIKGCERLYRHR